MSLGYQGGNSASVNGIVDQTTSVTGESFGGGFHAGNIGGGHIIQDGSAITHGNDMKLSSDITVPIPMQIILLI